MSEEDISAIIKHIQTTLEQSRLNQVVMITLLEELVAYEQIKAEIYKESQSKNEHRHL